MPKQIEKKVIDILFLFNYYLMSVSIFIKINGLIFFYKFTLNYILPGQLSYNVAMGVNTYLKNEEEYVPWESALSNLNYIKRMFTRSGNYGALKVVVTSVKMIEKMDISYLLFVYPRHTSSINHGPSAPSCWQKGHCNDLGFSLSFVPIKLL